jgi:hypothetical protein
MSKPSRRATTPHRAPGREPLSGLNRRIQRGRPLEGDDAVERPLHLVGGLPISTTAAHPGERGGQRRVVASLSRLPAMITTGWKPSRAATTAPTFVPLESS